MAAVLALLCSSLLDLYDLTDAWLWNGLSIQKSFRYLKVKRRLELFQLYCRELWLREKYKISLPESKKSIQSVEDNLESDLNRSNCQNKDSQSKMNRKRSDFVDFLNAERVDLEAYDALSSYGSAQLAVSNLDEEHGFDALKAIDDIEVLSSYEAYTSFYEYYDTTPVYVDQSIGPMQEGLSFTVKGTLPYFCERFSINFIVNNPTKDVAFHINPRLPQNYIVRNTKVKGTWGYEEVSSPLPFTLSRGAPFSVQVLVTEACYMLSVNGHHFAEYAHRVPYSLVSVLEVKGDVENVVVEKGPVESYPTRSAATQAKEVSLFWDTPAEETRSYDEIDGSRIPQEWRTIVPCNKKKQEEVPLPYYGSIPRDALKQGRCLTVEGRVRLLPQSFYINLQEGQDIWPHPNIAFHFNPRFTKQGGAIDRAIVCRNAWWNGKWDIEERSELVTDFRPGKVFRLSIVCGARSFEVYLNKKFMLDFRYRIPIEQIDTVYIQGDVKLWNVCLEECDFLEQSNNQVNTTLNTSDFVLLPNTSLGETI